MLASLEADFLWTKRSLYVALDTVYLFSEHTAVSSMEVFYMSIVERKSYYFRDNFTRFTNLCLDVRAAPM